MITAKKIRTLRPRVQLRKVASVFHQASKESPGASYLEEVLAIALSSPLLEEEDKKRLSYFYSRHGEASYEDICCHLLSALGESPADWDMVDEKGKADWSRRKVLGHCLFLDHLRSPYNVGSVFRNAEAFGVERIYLAPGTASPGHPRCRRTSRDAVDGVSWQEAELDALPDLPVFALELGGTEISSFPFPEEGICLIGSEETGLTKEARSLAESSLGLVSIHQLGVKGSVNVASATAVLLYKWMENQLFS